MENNKFKNIKLFLFDMDGTIYLGNDIFPFTVKLLNSIRAAGKDYMFITNNSSKSVSAYVEKLDKLGIKAEPDEFSTSAQATALYLKKHHKGKVLYVCGTKSFKNELESEGFKITEETDDAECVVMGYDTELNYKKLDDVSRILCTRDVPYIASHPDLVCPTEYGFVPDCGSVCEMIYNAAKKRPTVIGKPQPVMIELAALSRGVDVKNTAVVGDRLHTDVLSGINAGALSVLVMSGETTDEILKNSPVNPDVVLKDAGEIIKYL